MHLTRAAEDGCEVHPDLYRNQDWVSSDKETFTGAEGARTHPPTDEAEAASGGRAVPCSLHTPHAFS